MSKNNLVLENLIATSETGSAQGGISSLLANGFAPVRQFFRKGKDRATEAVTEIGKANLTVLRALWDLQRKATICRGLVNLGSVSAPMLGWWGSARMIDALSGNVSMGSGMVGAAAFTGSLAISGIIPVAMSSLERMSENCTFQHVFGKFTRKMITFTPEQLGDPTLAEQVKQVRERAVWRMMAMAKGQSQLVRTFGMLTVTGITVAFKAPELLPVVVVFGLPSMITELLHARSRSVLEAKLSPQWGALWGDLANLMTAQALAMLNQFGAERWFAARYRKGLADTSEYENVLESDASISRVVYSLTAGLGLAASIIWLYYRAATGALSVGDFVLLSGAVAGVSGCLSEFASLIGQQWSQAQSINDFAAFLKHPASKEISMRKLPLEQEYELVNQLAGTATEAGAGETDHLRFEDIWLHYASAPEGEHAVRQLSFSVKRGSVVAVVGPNGAGKSSSMAMMLRQFRPTRGKILLNGEDIQCMSQIEFSSQVVMLPQQLRHYNLTLRELLNLGRSLDPVSDEVLWAELERVGAADFVRKWKNGLGTQLSVDRREAVEPSGGQLQRLLLAAVVIANRGLIVLDEPVSMVDPEAAKQFWDAMFAERTDRTVIFSTHHLGAVRRADKILFIEGGTLAVEGTHDQLMETSEQYRQLFNAQADDYR